MFDAVDARADAAFAPLRGKPAVDRAAAAVSNLSDYGIVWVLLALFKARSRGRRRRAIVSLAGAGSSSLSAVRAVKSVVERQRPEDHLAVSVRTPSSSSFPSGHTLAAFCTSVVMAETTAETVAYTGFSAAVAVSRVHVRAHHPSDVVGGAVLGSLLGLAVRRVVDVVAPSPRRIHRARVRTRRRARGMQPGATVLKQL